VYLVHESRPAAVADGVARVIVAATSPRGVVNANSPRLPELSLISDNDKSSATRSAYTVVAVDPP
jgi:hypothetical protein